MQSSYWGYWLVVMGVAIIGLMISVQGLTTNTNEGYLSTKEIAEASLLEAVDYGYYRDYNEIKINKEKFMEVFLRMTAEVMSATDQYEINFYALYEAPPKVSVEVKSNSGSDFVNAGYDTTNRVDAIIQIHAEDLTTNSGNSNTISNGGSGSNGAGSNSSSIGSSNNNASNSGNNNANGNSNETSNGSSNHNSSNSGTGSNSGSSGNHSSSINNGNSSGSGNSSSNHNSSNSGNVSNSGSSGNHSGSLNNGSSNGSGNNSSNTGTNSGNSNVCTEGIKTTLLKGIQGTAMISSKIYESSSFKKSTGTATPGVKFEILGENANADKWAITYNGKCGWVANKDMAINMAQYIKEASFQILNASSSMYKSSGKNISGLTGRKLYSSEYTNSWVPGTFSFARKLKVAAVNAKKAGDTIVVYDAYRPKSVSTYANSKLTALYNSDKTVKANIDKDSKGNTWGKTWFLAQTVSMHNIGCAVDAAIRGANDTPTAIHELSTWAAKYESSRSKTYSATFKKSATAQRLSNYMMNAGLGDLASEWWHYQDNSCSISKSSPANFWSAV